MTIFGLRKSFFFLICLLLYPFPETLFIFLPTAQAQETWTCRSPKVGSDGVCINDLTLRDVTFNGSQFVAVGGDGGAVVESVILSSPDGVTWTSRYSKLRERYEGVTFGNSLFVAVGNKILTSPDGVTWTDRTPKSVFLHDVIFAGSQFVAVGISGMIFTSSDGVTWSEQDSGTTRRLRGVTFDGSQYVAVGGAGIPSATTILTSPDGVTWTDRSPDFGKDLYGVTFGNSLFAAVGFLGIILTSPDGITWTERNSITALFGGEDVAFGNSLFVGVDLGGDIATSSDGITWSLVAFGIVKALYGVIFTGSQFVAVGAFGEIVTSPDGVNWTSTSIQPSATTVDLNEIAFDGSKFVVVGGSVRRDPFTGADLPPTSIILTSSDGATWSEQDSGITSPLNGVVFNGSQFVAVGSGGTILTSPDGVTWVSRTSGTSSNLNDVSSGSLARDQLFVAVGDSGKILTSPDGVTWTSQTLDTTETLRGVAFGNSLFVAVGDNGTILTSPDGLTWTSQTSGGISDISDVTFGNSLFVRVGGEGGATSPDGETWTTFFAGTSRETLRGITFGGRLGEERFVAVGSFDVFGTDPAPIFTSLDGVTWTSSPLSDPIRTLNSVAFGGTQFVAVGNFGTILTSPATTSIPAMDSVTILILVLLIGLVLSGLIAKRRSRFQRSG